MKNPDPDGEFMATSKDITASKIVYKTPGLSGRGIVLSERHDKKDPRAGGNLRDHLFFPSMMS
jgi:hypothetical protein